MRRDWLEALAERLQEVLPDVEVYLPAEREEDRSLTVVGPNGYSHPPINYRGKHVTDFTVTANAEAVPYSDEAWNAAPEGSSRTLDLEHLTATGEQVWLWINPPPTPVAPADFWPILD